MRITSCFAGNQMMSTARRQSKSATTTVRTSETRLESSEYNGGLCAVMMTGAPNRRAAAESIAMPVPTRRPVAVKTPCA